MTEQELLQFYEDNKSNQITISGASSIGSMSLEDLVRLIKLLGV